MVAILAWALMVVAVTSDGKGGTDLQRQVVEEVDRYSRFPSDCTVTLLVYSFSDTMPI